MIIVVVLLAVCVTANLILNVPSTQSSLYGVGYEAKNGNDGRYYDGKIVHN